MRSKLDVKIDTRGRKQKPKPLPGGKVLQRLFSYFTERDPTLSSEVVATIPVPKVARPRFALTRRALRAKPVNAATLAKPRRGPPATKPFAAALLKAAAALPQPDARPHRRRGSGAAAARSAAPAPAAPPSTWRAIGPSNIPNGQTYGTTASM